MNEDRMLERQKDAAIAIIKDSNTYNRNVELVRDDTFNESLK